MHGLPVARLPSQFQAFATEQANGDEGEPKEHGEAETDSPEAGGEVLVVAIRIDNQGVDRNRNQRGLPAWDGNQRVEFGVHAFSS